MDRFASLDKAGTKAEFTAALRQLTKDLALRVIRLHRQLPATEESRVIGRQLLRSATSVGANYRALCRARSEKEHFAKLSICIEEADETLFWLELLGEAEIVPASRLHELHHDYSRVVAILTTARKTASR
ncbi:four helix bundle protein [Hymenobacter latericus]|uniref:four helix bundle protein n=1 Tax=Hymenobacter sp. YIM 151858-1 TaxID=2987688 RepID=UPI002225EDFC|nr:four helix bundle protein [Hymenobacter sp. YIM 151858-1]UYZ59308.1 four helix bundle protein [Hymenobacter sp. YIM 151858-1]